jgi:hypothetical protein
MKEPKYKVGDKFWANDELEFVVLSFDSETGLYEVFNDKVGNCIFNLSDSDEKINTDNDSTQII